MVEIDMVRNNVHIDPSLQIWGWEIPVYLFLGGVTAGLMILTAILGARAPEPEQRSRWLRWLPFAGPVLLSVGMFALWLDLENHFRAYRFYLAFQFTSPMSWGAWILLAIYPATLMLGFAGLTESELSGLQAWKPVAKLRLAGVVGWITRLSRRHVKGLRLANVLLGIALGAYTGLLLGTLAARAAWNSALLGPLFLVSGFSTGAALMMLFPNKHEEHAVLRRWDAAAIGLELLLLLLFLLHLGAGGGQEGRDAAGLFLGGPYTAVFWSLVVIAGLLIPLVIETLESRHRLRPTLVAPTLLLIGGLSLRWILVMAGQA